MPPINDLQGPVFQMTIINIYRTKIKHWGSENTGQWAVTLNLCQENSVGQSYRIQVDTGQIYIQETALYLIYSFCKSTVCNALLSGLINLIVLIGVYKNINVILIVIL